MGGTQGYARLLAAAAHDPAALLRFHRRSAASSAVLLAAEAAVLATAVSLPWAAVGLGPVDTAAAVRNFLTLGEATAALPPPLGELGHGLAVAAVLAAALVAAFTVLNTVSDLRTQRRAGQPLLLLVQAAQPDHPDLGALRALTPRTRQQRGWATLSAAARDVEVVLRFHALLPALLVGDFGLPALPAWAVLVGLFFLSVLRGPGGWRTAAHSVPPHAAAAALYLFFLPGSLLVPLLVTALNGPAAALTPLAGPQAPPRVLEVLPDTEEPR